MTGFVIGDPSSLVLETGDEIEDLSRVFSDTVDKVNRQAQSLVASEQEKAVTTYKLLTTQLDPHFVCNTMNIINILARQHRNDDIIAINSALRRILRERLNTSTGVFDTVQKEVDTLRQYMLIMNYRYENKVQMDYDIDPSVQECLIVKNVLQPLVENAFYHGLTNKSGDVSGSISVLIYSMEDRVVIEINDDGKGFDPILLRQIRENNFRVNRSDQLGDTHIGLENIYDRLKHIYNDCFSMEINSEVGFGSTIVLSLPKDVDVSL